MEDDWLNSRKCGCLRSLFHEHCYDVHHGSGLGVPVPKPFVPSGDSSFGVDENAGYYTPLPLYNDQLGRGGEFGVNVAPPQPLLTDYMKESWAYQPENFLPFPGFGVMPELAQGGQPQAMYNMSQPVMGENVGMLDGLLIGNELGSIVNSGVDSEGQGLMIPKMKKLRRDLFSAMENGLNDKRSKQPKKSVDVVVNGIMMDISRFPIPFCSCTGSPQLCYRWGSGGWQSACCTNYLSDYPLPMSTKRPGVRIAGRKMSVGAFKKVLEKLASENYDFSKAIDLRTHWAKHGTNKFVTRRLRPSTAMKIPDGLRRSQEDDTSS